MTNVNHQIPELLKRSASIAVVGLSAKPSRPSHEVAHYLQQQGYRIVPVNPTYAGTHILGELCYATLREAAAALAMHHEAIDLVDCFRKAQDIGPIADQAVEIGADCLWMQLGIVNEQAAATARAKGLDVVMDRCIKIEHMQQRQ